MKLRIAKLTITRNSGEIPVEVAPDNTSIGYGADGEKHILSRTEEEEAVEKLFPDEGDILRDHDDYLPTGREADAIADRYFQKRGRR